jgi:predicted N-formylglutamate amidohydrolase
VKRQGKSPPVQKSLSGTFQPMTRSALFAPFEVVEGDRKLGLVLLADHARRDLPEEYAGLGLPAEEFQRHIAYDIGVEMVTRKLAALTGAPAVLANFSRLLIDPNRGEDDPTLIMRLSDGAVVPGNAGVDAAARERRIARFHAPYHAAIAAAIEESLALGAVPALVSIHSFTPVWRGRQRPWHAGVLWDRDPRLAAPLIAALAAEANLVVGDNEPYSGRHPVGYALGTYANGRGLAPAVFEVRQDLIETSEKAHIWARRLAHILRPLLGGRIH